MKAMKPSSTMVSSSSSCTTSVLSIIVKTMVMMALLSRQDLQTSHQSSSHYTWCASAFAIHQDTTTISTRNRAFQRGGNLSTTAAATTTSLLSMSSSTSNREYDLVVIGGGSAGLTAAKLAGKTLSKSVCIIEKEKLGGDCTWTGCVPSKSLLASAKAAKIVRREILSSKSSSSSSLLSFESIQQRYKSIQQEIYDADDSPEVLKNEFQVDTIPGNAVLTSGKTVSVTSTTSSTPFTVTAKEGIVLCTGAKPKTNKNIDLNVEGIDDVPFVTYEEVWDLPTLPKKLTIVGGGPVGCELAQAFARLGSKVTMVVSGGRLLPKEEPEVSEILTDIFVNDEGIQIVSGRLQKVEATNTKGGHIATTTTGATVSGDCLLLSIGRTPNTKGLGLEALGIELNENGGIAVNDKLQTSVRTIYAAGDCTGDRQFTHYAGYQGAIAARNILLPLSDPGILSSTGVPATTFTSPEVASVGYTEAQAREEFGDDAIAVASVRLDHVDRAICEGETKGIMKVVYRKRKGTILGATMMAPCGGELISEICVAMKAGMSFEDLAKVSHPYPSYAFALQVMAADAYYAKLKKSVPVYNVLKKLGL